MKEIHRFLYNPIIATNIILICILVYFIVLSRNNIFDESFFHFGPGTNEKNTITFINTKVDNWRMVWIVWIIGFTSTALQKYYWTAIYDYVYLNIKNPSVKKINYHKSSLTYMLFFKSFISILLHILNIFTYLTWQLQFIIPSLLTSLLISFPVNLSQLNSKSYVPINGRKRAI